MAESPPPMLVLIVDDDPSLRRELRPHLEARSWEVHEAGTAGELRQALAAFDFDLVLLDQDLPDADGLEVLGELRTGFPDTVVIMLSGAGTVPAAVEAVRRGAADFVLKPVDPPQVLAAIDRALADTSVRRDLRRLRERLRREHGFDRIIGQCPEMLALFEMIRGIAATSSTVFLRGETGTGKDLVASVIHYCSERAAGPFMTVTCTTISETLLESELFGHEKGAFTDARTLKKGLFEIADGGTVFLDEVGDMPPPLQAKLLHFLENRWFRRVGGTREIPVDVRVIAATNRDIEAAVASGQFRQDLMYRLNVLPIFLPPLRERGEDILLLARHFADQFAREFHKTIRGIDEVACRRLMSYHWPGNVRELRNVIERAVLLCKGTILHASDVVLNPGRGGAAGATTDRLEAFNLPPGGLDLAMLEKRMLAQAMAQAAGNQVQAARLLHMTRHTLRYRLRKYGLL